MVNLTKKAIMDSFLKLLNERPFDKITVKDIVEECGVNRNTFYYHYHDIFELLAEILEADLQKIAEDSPISASWQNVLLQTMTFAIENKKALYHLYNSMNRRQVEKYVIETSNRTIRTFITYKSSEYEINEEDLSRVVMFYSSAVSGMLLQWIDGNMRQDPEIEIQRMGILLEGTVDIMLQNAVNNNF